MKKILIAAISIVLAVIAIAGILKLTAKEPAPTEDDILAMSERKETALPNNTDSALQGNISEEQEGEQITSSSDSISIEAELDSVDTPKPEENQEPTGKSVATPTPELLPTQEPTPETTPAKSTGKPLNGLVIGIDPGHQAKGNKDTEPNAPGSSEMKAKVSSGTAGKTTGIAEHKINLSVGLHLKKLLKDAGAKVIMTRESADVDISNIERAKLFNDNKVDLGVRLHCNGSTDENVRGAFMLVPKDKAYPYYNESVKAAKTILEAFGKETGIDISKGITYRDDQTGFNWCERPIVNIEMGHLSNKEDETILADSSFQKKMAEGIFNGIVEYFN